MISMEKTPMALDAIEEIGDPLARAEEAQVLAMYARARAKAATSVRNAAIREAAGGGVMHRLIGERVGVSKSVVDQITKASIR